MTTTLLALLLTAAEPGAVEGRVVEADGAAWAQGSVCLLPLGDPGGPERRAETDGEGRFRLEGLEPGEYGLFLVGPSPPPTIAEGTVETFAGVFVSDFFGAIAAVDRDLNRSRAPYRVTVASGATAKFERTLPGRVTVEGRVLCAGTPLPGAILYLETPPDIPVRSIQPLPSLRSAPDGSFRAGPLYPGVYFVNAEVGPFTAGAGSLVVPAEDGAPSTVTIPSASLRLRVLDANGAPVRKLNLVARREGSDDLLSAKGLESATGEYLLLHLEPGRHTLRLNCGFVTAHVASFDLPARGGELLATLPPTGTLLVRARGPEGLPAAEVSILLVPGGENPVEAAAATDEKGTLAATVATGRWRISCGDASVIADVKAGETTTVEFDVPKHLLPEKR